MLRFLTYAFAFSLFMLPAISQAAKIDDKGAERLKTLFLDIIEDQKQAMKLSESNLETKGEVTVEQAKSYYAVTLPEIVLTNDEGKQTHLGFIAVNATPTDDPNNWKMSVAIPTPILQKDAEGKTTTEINIGSQKMVGLWHGGMDNFSQLKANYKDITAKNVSKNHLFNVSEVNMLVDLKETGDGLWSGPSKITLSDMNLDTPEAQDVFTLGNVTLLVSMKDLDPLKHKKAAEELSSIEVSETSTHKSLGIIDNLLKASGDALSLKGTLSDLKLKTKEKADKPSKEIKLEKMAFDYSIEGIQGDNVDLTIGLNYRGDTQKEETDKALMPHTAGARITLNNFPMTRIISIGQSTLPKDDANPNAQKVAALQAMMTLPQILAESGTTLEIKDTQYGNNTYFVNFDGMLKANKNSMLGASGDLILKVTGLEKLRAALQKETSDDDSKEQRMIDQALKRLTFVEKISKKEGDKHISHLALGENGKITINGEDAKAVMSGKPAEAPAEEKSAEPSEEESE